MRGAGHGSIRGEMNRTEPRNSNGCIRHGQVTLMAGDAPDSNFTISLPSIRHIPFELLDAARAQTTRISASLIFARSHTLSLSAGLKGCWCSSAWLRPI